MSVFSFRTTTNGVLRNYRSNLSKSYSRLNTCMTRIQTQRKFNSYAEDPSAASRGFQIRRALWRANDQLTNTNNTISKFQTGFSAVGTICDGDVDHPGLNGIAASLSIVHDPMGGSRVSLGQELNSEADGVVQMMNATYNDNFVFAGADGKNVPFTWKLDAAGNKMGLLYRGIDVDTPDPKLLEGCTAKYDEQMGKLMGPETLPTGFEPSEVREYSENTYPDGLKRLELITRRMDGDTLVETRRLIRCNDPDDPTDQTEESNLTTKTRIEEHNTGDDNRKEWVKTVQEFDASAGAEELLSTTKTTVQTRQEPELDTAGQPTGNTVVTRNSSTAVEKFENGVSLGTETTTDDPVKTTVTGAENIFEETFGMSLEQAEKDYATLQKYLGETTYTDIGLGLREDENGTVPTSAYDTALHGLKFIGYGMDEDGDPKNVVTLMRKLAAVCSRCDPETGTFAKENNDEEVANRLVNKLRAAIGRVSEAHVELSARSTYLISNVKLLGVTEANLDERRADLEDIDPALAITEMNQASTCYNAALKIGTNILSESLLDYMK